MMCVATNADEIGKVLHELFPLNRSLTGDWVRKSLDILQSITAFERVELASGTRVFDWTIPDEWRVHQAFVETVEGQRVIDFAEHNLHLVGYSAPFRGELSYADLDAHLHSLPDQPDAIPYRTSYYQRDWGFCLTHRKRELLDRNTRYRVVIDSEHFRGSLTLAEAYLPGHSGSEFVIHSYCCHPSMANDNLSGMVLWALLLRELRNYPARRHGYRFVLAPETIGALAYLHRHQRHLAKVVGGMVLTTVAGPGPFSLKLSYQGTSRIDRAARAVLDRLEPAASVRPFDVFGSDERQYSSPGFRIPMITIARSQYYHYPEYHCSLDNLDFISPDSLLASLDAHLRLIDVLERDRTVLSLSPFGEPMLGRHGLYPQVGGAIRPDHDRRATLRASLWTCFLGDGKHTLLDIAERSGERFDIVTDAADALRQAELIALLDEDRPCH